MKISFLHPGARLPERATPGSAGLDIFAAEDVLVPSALVIGDAASIGRALIGTGIAIEIPPGCVAKLGSRSGLSMSSNIEIGAGWIDSDYRGEIKVEVKNLSATPFRVSTGMRIAQLFLLRIETPVIEIVPELGQSERGQGGFGSTGLR